MAVRRERENETHLEYRKNLLKFREEYDYIRLKEVPLSNEKVADSLVWAKGSGRTMQQFARQCRSKIEETFGPEMAARAGASPSTFSRIAKIYSRRFVEESEMIKRPLDLILVWAMWEVRQPDENESARYDMDRFFKANNYIRSSQEHKMIVEERERRGEYRSSRDYTNVLYNKAKDLIGFRLGEAGYYTMVFRNLQTALERINSGDEDMKRIEKAVPSSSDQDVSVIDTLLYGYRNIASLGRSRNSFVFKLMSGDLMFWSFRIYDFETRVRGHHSEKAYFPFTDDEIKALFLRDCWEPETMPDSIIKNTIVFIDKDQFDFYKKLLGGVEVNSLMSLIYVDVDAEQIEEYNLPRKGKKEAFSIF